MAQGMKVQFEFTAADLAEVGTRSVNRSPLFRSWRRVGRLAWAILVGLIAFSIVSGTIEFRVAVGALAAVALFAAATLRARMGNRNPRLEKFYRERLGGDGPFLCEVEITKEGVISRQLGSESRHPWAQVASISEIRGGIEFVYRPIGSLLVRDRAFSDEHVRARFLELARSFLPAEAKV